jgi:hypothetical protein
LLKLTLREIRRELSSAGDFRESVDDRRPDFRKNDFPECLLKETLEDHGQGF